MPRYRAFALALLRVAVLVPALLGIVIGPAPAQAAPPTKAGVAPPELLPVQYAANPPVSGDIPEKPPVRGTGLFIVGLSLLAVGGTTAGISSHVLSNNLRSVSFANEENGALVAAAVSGGILAIVGSILGTIGGVQLIVSTSSRGQWERRYGKGAAMASVSPFVTPDGGAGGTFALRF